MFKFLRRKPKALPPPPPPNHEALLLDPDGIRVTKYADVPVSSENRADKREQLKRVPVINGEVPYNAVRTYYLAWHLDMPKGVAREFGGTTPDEARVEMLQVNGLLGCRPGCPGCAYDVREQLGEFEADYGKHLGSLASEVAVEFERDNDARLTGPVHPLGTSPRPIRNVFAGAQPVQLYAMPNAFDVDPEYPMYDDLDLDLGWPLAPVPPRKPSFWKRITGVFRRGGRR